MFGSKTIIDRHCHSTVTCGRLEEAPFWTCGDYDGGNDNGIINTHKYNFMVSFTGKIKSTNFVIIDLCFGMNDSKTCVIVSASPAWIALEGSRDR